MGKNQGVIRLRNGCKRKLTSSEKTRGYIFITTDSVARDLVNKGNVLIDNKIFECKKRKNKIDKYGRLVFGIKNAREVGDSEIFFITKKGDLFINLKNNYAE